MVSIRRLKRLLLICFVLCFGLLLFYATNRSHKPIVGRPHEDIKAVEQETTARSTESERDSVDLTQQPARPGDEWEEPEHRLDDHEDVHDTLQWLQRVGTRPPDLTTTTDLPASDTNLHTTENLSNKNKVIVRSSETLPTSHSQDTAVPSSENEEQVTEEVTLSPSETTSKENEQSTQESTVAPSETTSIQDERSTQESTLSPSETTSKENERSTQEATVAPSETTSQQDVSKEESTHTTLAPNEQTTLRKEQVSGGEQSTRKASISPNETTSKQNVSSELEHGEEGSPSRNDKQQESTKEQRTEEVEHTQKKIFPSSTTQATATASTQSMQKTWNNTTVGNRSAVHLSTTKATATATAAATTTTTTTTSAFTQEKQTGDSSTETHHRNVTTTTTATTTLSGRAQQGLTTAYTPAPPENACRLPKLDPWDPSIRHLLKDVGDDPGCNREYPLPLFEVVSNKLVRKTNADTIDFRQVKVETIHRSRNTDTDFYYVDEGNPFNVSAGKTQISKVIDSTDYFRLAYKVNGDSDRHVHFFARVVPQPVVKETARKLRQTLHPALDLNVFIIGFDSTSRANFLRKMPNSLAFLRNQLSTFFFEGYSIIGDATTPALTALLTGKYVTELPEGRRGWSNSKQIDDWPWIMREYEKRGYVTMYAEDDVPVSTFNLRLLGFKKPPTHHYIRPFWMAVERAGARDGPGVCSKSISMVNYTLEYLTSFHEAYPDTLKFAFSFMSYIAHAHPNHLSYADKDLLRFLKTFVRRRQHENSILIVFGDHGSRNDDVRDTMQGKLEERLPWLSISVPKWLRDKHPDVMRALAHNQHVISTPFDLHATLHHVLTFPDTPPKEKTQSLFTKLDTKRTCSDAGIDEHWCPCLQFKPADTNSPDVQRIGEATVKFINELLSKEEFLRSSCAELHLETIHAAFTYEANEKLRSFESTNQDTDRAVNFGSSTRDHPHYQVTVQTMPGNGLFEATVTVEDGHIRVNPHISRINRYGDQANCVIHTYPYARKYCFCVN